MFHGSIARLGSNAESMCIHQSEHLVISSHDDALHYLESARAGSLDKAENEHRTHAALLPGVRYGNREFAAGPVRVDDIARNTDFGFLCVFANHRDQCHLLVVVDLCKSVQHRVVQFAQRTHESKISRFIRKPLYEFLLYLPVLGPDRTHNYARAIAQGYALHQFRRIGFCHLQRLVDAHRFANRGHSVPS